MTLNNNGKKKRKKKVVTNMKRPALIVNRNSPVVGLVAALAQAVLTSFYCSLTAGHKPINSTTKGQRKHE